MRGACIRRALVALTGLLLLPGLLEAATISQVAARLRQKIMSKFECQKLEVCIVPYDGAGYAEQGRFRAVSVRADAAARWGVTMRPLFIKATDVRMDLPALFGPEFRVDATSTDSELHLELTEEELNNALRHKQNKVPNLRADLGRGLITLTGTYKFVFGNSFRVSGTLACPDGYRINFVPKAVKVNGVPIPPGALSPLLKKMNPLIDLSELTLSPKVRSITIDEGRMVIR